MNTNEFDLFEQFARIEWLLRRYNQQKHKNHGPLSDPHRGQGRILAMLKLQPEISQKELSFLLDIRPQSLGELLGKLERGGYITRTPSQKDRRIMEIHLTDKGLEAANPQSDLDKLLNCLNEDEQLNLADYLNRLIETLEAQLNDEAEEINHPNFEWETEPHPHDDPQAEDGPHSDQEKERPSNNWNFDPCNLGAHFNDFINNLHDTFDHNFNPQDFGDRIRSTFDSNFDPEVFKENLRETFGTDFDLRTFMNDNFPNFDGDFMENLWNCGKKDEKQNTEDSVKEEAESHDFENAPEEEPIKDVCEDTPQQEEVAAEDTVTETLEQESKTEKDADNA